MKRFIFGLLLIIDLILLGLSNYEFNTNKNNYISNNIIAAINEDSILNYYNIYHQDKSYNYVTSIINNKITNKQDILNLIYTTINNGYDSYDFLCSKDYLTCTDDLISILNDGNIINIINSLVHPYNSAKGLSLTYNPSGFLRLNVIKLYSNQEIELIDQRINSILSLITNDNMTEKQKIKKVHDYLANNISYVNSYKSNTAYGAMIYKEAICSGYSDALALFLTKMNIPNYKIVSKTHVWNIVYMDGKWLHIDLTYDDPNNIFSTNTSNYNYFLISTDEILSMDKTDHNFDLTIYSELS